METKKDLLEKINLLNTYINLFLVDINSDSHKLLKNKKITLLISDIFNIVSGKIKSRLLYELFLNNVSIKDNLFIYNGHKQISYDKSYVILFTRTYLIQKVKNLNIMYLDISVFSFIVEGDISDYKYNDYSWVDVIISNNKINTVEFIKLQKIILTLDNFASTSKTFQIEDIPENLEIKEFIILVYKNFLFFLLELVEPNHKKGQLPAIDKILKNIIKKLDN